MKWNIKENDKKIINELCFECGITQLQANLLINRGIDTVEKANMYLYGDMSDIYSPSDLLNLDDSAHMIAKYIKEGKEIRLVTD